ncbi:hypothetical protein D3C72_1943880 [compost metagenome]
MTVGIVADVADHRHRRPEARRGHRLVGALAARHGGKRLACQGLAGTRQALGAGYQVHVEATYHYYLGVHDCSVLSGIH